MSNVISLDSIRDAAQRKYGNVTISDPAFGEVELVNPLKLSKDKRAELLALQEASNDEGNDPDPEVTLAAMIRCVASYEPAADALLEAVGGDLTILAQIVEQYMEATSSGEASASAS